MRDFFFSWLNQIKKEQMSFFLWYEWFIYMTWWKVRIEEVKEEEEDMEEEENLGQP